MSSSPNHTYYSSPFGSIKESCARAVLRKLDAWFGTCEAGPHTNPSFNVFIADFVDLDEDQFIKTVIQLNLTIADKIEKVGGDEDQQGHCLEMVPEDDETM